MALFNIIAKKEDQIEWAKIHAKLIPDKYKYLSFFPIPKDLGITADCIGISGNAKYEEEMKEIKKELIMALEVLWANNFVVVDLYKGVEITLDTYSNVYSYI